VENGTLVAEPTTVYTPEVSAIAAPVATDVIRVRRWPTERPLLYLNLAIAALLWIILFRLSPQTVAGMAVFVGFMALVNMGFVAHIRGSAVRLGPDQFPDLYRRVEELARRMELRRIPEVYLMQQDGALNAFATRFLRSHMVVLLTDLLDACGSNHAARDMIIGHELGHIRAGHLRFHWILLPLALVPFVGSALSRAREYTCDRYGRAAAGDEDGALLGLTILAAGRTYAPLVDRRALARQHAGLSRGWMLVGQWMATHPPISKRLIALKPDILDASVADRSLIAWGRPVFAAVTVVLAGTVSMSYWQPRQHADPYEVTPDSPTVRAQVQKDLEALRSFLAAEVNGGRPLPWDVDDLYSRWSAAKKDGGPRDPFSGAWYDYDQRGGAYRLWSMGPDGLNRTADDIVFDSRN
jgi:Zn-dependent protease with chaperone function